jgi:hypothetical protein
MISARKKYSMIKFVDNVDKLIVLNLDDMMHIPIYCFPENSEKIM